MTENKEIIENKTPKPVKAKKELTPEQQQKRRQFIAIPIFVLVFIGVIY